MPLPAPRWIERALFLVAIICLGTWVYAFVDTRLTEMREERRLDEAIRQRTAAAGTTAAETDALGSFQVKDRDPDQDEKDELARLAAEDSSENLEEGDLIGRIKIPSVDVSAIVLHGVGAKTLRRSVGHIPGTALPDQDGNVGLAGHRDSFFRGLKDIRKNDVIELTTLDGTFEYRVDWTKIVRPEDTGVLADEGSPALTLVTCYPFYYVGSAPKRFIVRAHRVDESQAASRPAG